MIKNQNHPKKGSAIKVQPITRMKDIATLKQILSPRDLCLFTIGINTGLRASDLIRIRLDQVQYLEPMEELEPKEKKNAKYKRINFNKTCVEATQAYLATRKDDFKWLFPNPQGEHISAPYVNSLVKGWCKRLNLKGNYGSHTLRKTFGYMQRTKYNASVALLVFIFNHRSEKQTLDYLCIQPEEIKEVYSNNI